ncbi:phosphotransferase family protein [Rhodococcus sp. ARC_M6]|uniref:phosphotransferase family protein n=1 Tax=Rhodococcus sp. ARC_M6 TaxID=2928852 RepID=UPI001FB33ECE|nr:phosphotransferase family protein [Rhodococcus sp. ARC_M6]MCJ0905417.1 phosphotransferase family protein [Rhodococcus sp. ARC_M6]
MDNSSVVDMDRLTSWMDENGIGTGPVTDVVELAGGTQNILIRFSRGGQDLVFRRPPLHKRKNSDETMRREAVVLAGLADSDVPHPRLIASCDDHDVLGCQFFIMEAITGFTATSEVPDTLATSLDQQHDMGLSMIDALAALGRIDPETAGVSNLGRADGWLERQVAKWRKQLDSYSELEGWPGSSGLPDIDRLGVWLQAHRPQDWQPGLIHGDFHFGNVMFRLDVPKVAAIIDWELATIGDPLLDLGHLLATWPNETERRTIGLAKALPGLPTRDELIAQYSQGSTRDLSNVDWYQALACYRLGILLEGTYARSCAGKAAADLGKRLHLTAESLIEQGLSIVDRTHVG